jgi:hypothetical protein
VETNIKKLLVSLDSMMLHNLSNPMPPKLQIIIATKGEKNKY